MKEDIDRADRIAAERVIVPPEAAVTRLAVAKGVEIPCPGADPGDCDSAELLEDHARWVKEVLELIPDSERTAGQEVNLGYALAVLDDWAAAKAAFDRGARSPLGEDDDRTLARQNRDVAASALA
jgi:hypothetical protein